MPSLFSHDPPGSKHLTNHCRFISCFVRQPRRNHPCDHRRLLPQLISEACAQCRHGVCLRTTDSSFSSDEEEEEESLDNNLDNKHVDTNFFIYFRVIILEIQSRAMKKAERRPYNDYHPLPESLHWVLSPATGKLLMAPTMGLGEKNEKEEEDDECDDDGAETTFYSVNTCLSQCSSSQDGGRFSMKEISSVWDEFRHCDGWPFGLSRRAAVMLPPLPSSPAESWIWHKRGKAPNVYSSNLTAT